MTEVLAVKCTRNRL